MKAMIRELFFDKEVVNKLKTSRLTKEHKYNLLYAGKITLQEYLEADA